MDKSSPPLHVAIMLFGVYNIPLPLIRANIEEVSLLAFNRGIQQISFFQQELSKRELLNGWTLPSILPDVELRILEHGRLPYAKKRREKINLGFKYSEKKILLNILREKENSWLDEAEVRQYFEEREWLEPDLLILTAGVRSLGDCLTWSAAYSELFFCSVSWSEFTGDELLRALLDYEGRKRRFGKVLPA